MSDHDGTDDVLIGGLSSQATVRRTVDGASIANEERIDMLRLTPQAVRSAAASGRR
jgi:hypothetical protein